VTSHYCAPASSAEMSLVAIGEEARLHFAAKHAFGLPDDLETGCPVPENGFYRVMHSQHCLPKEVTLMLGQSFPRCSKCAEPVYFELIRYAPSLAMSTFKVALYELPEVAEPDE
jgi:hypothetical protein